MSLVHRKAGRIRRFVILIALSTSSGFLAAQAQKTPATVRASSRMADGKQWTTQNLSIKTAASYCYDDAENNCSRYGRLYTWEAAQAGCRALGKGWRLPAEADWRELAKPYGGIFDNSEGSGQAAYKALLTGGNSGFNAMLGGGRDQAGKYARIEAHGFYWTVSETDPSNAVFFNFAKGRLTLFRQAEGEKPRAFLVRCVRD